MFVKEGMKIIYRYSTVMLTIANCYPLYVYICVYMYIYIYVYIHRVALALLLNLKKELLEAPFEEIMVLLRNIPSSCDAATVMDVSVLCICVVYVLIMCQYITSLPGRFR